MSRRPTEEASLELMPVMNLVAILIPMLLMGATVVNLAVIDAAAPAIVKDDRPPVDPGLQLTVAITDQGLGIQGAARELEGEGQQLRCAVQPCTVEGYDYDGLTAALARVKDDHPDEGTVILLAEAQVPYEVLVKVMDAAREDTDQRDAAGEPRSLFPQVVMAGGAG